MRGSSISDLERRVAFPVLSLGPAREPIELARCLKECPREEYPCLQAYRVHDLDGAARTEIVLLHRRDPARDRLLHASEDAWLLEARVRAFETLLQRPALRAHELPPALAWMGAPALSA